MEPVRWGVIGCANIALRRVIPAMQPAQGVSLWAIASRSLDKAQAAAEQFGFGKAHGSYEALLADPEIEAVYIPLPNQLHKEWAVAALRAGKHVLCEKPLALNAEEAREMQTVAQEAGLYLLEAFMYRFGPLVQTALDQISAGRLGELRALHSAFNFRIADDPANVRLRPDTGGGCLYDVGCYCFNMLRMAAGREPMRAWATIEWSERYGVDMSAAGVLDFGQGLLATFNTGFRSSGGTFLRAVGEEGKLELPDGFILHTGEGRVVITRGDEAETLSIPAENSYTLEVEDLSTAVRGLSRPRFAWEPLDANMRVIDACYAAHRAGGFATI
ncbi:MAG: Gfo/Idh/MocA family oxidoreductase [Anaerolineae bacterium]|nr:Gfo/Idh/MocA family oxidoreductase [Anaerolineae bacterium]